MKKETLNKIPGHELIRRKLIFIEKYKLKPNQQLGKDIIQKAREEIGYSDKTVDIDINCSLSKFIKENAR